MAWECLECGSINPTANVICGSATCQERRLRADDADPQAAVTIASADLVAMAAEDLEALVAGRVADAVAGVSSLDLKNLTPATRKTHSYPAEFEVWWEVYPLHRDKVAALRAWRAARKSASADELREAALRYRNDPQRKPDFTKYPATWLNAGAWQDEGEAITPPPPQSKDARYQPYDHEAHLRELEDIG